MPTSQSLWSPNSPLIPCKNSVDHIALLKCNYFFTSFPFVSPFSYHSTVTLLVSRFTPLIMDEWTRPTCARKVFCLQYAIALFLPKKDILKVFELISSYLFLLIFYLTILTWLAKISRFLTKVKFVIHQAWVVWTVDNTIQQTYHYPADSVVWFVNN